MTERQIKDMQKQLQREAEMTARQATLIKQLYTERDGLANQIEIIKLALNLMTKLTAQWPTK